MKSLKNKTNTSRLFYMEYKIDYGSRLDILDKVGKGKALHLMEWVNNIFFRGNL